MAPDSLSACLVKPHQRSGSLFWMRSILKRCEPAGPCHFIQQGAVLLHRIRFRATSTDSADTLIPFGNAKYLTIGCDISESSDAIFPLQSFRRMSTPRYFSTTVINFARSFHLRL